MITERDKRISVDIDNKSRFKLLKVYLNMVGLFGWRRVIAEESRHGYHVKAIDVDRTVEQNLAVRRNMGDDINRLTYDEAKHYSRLDRYVDVLFSVKRYFDGVYSTEEVNPLAEPFWNFEQKRANNRRKRKHMYKVKSRN